MIYVFSHDLSLSEQIIDALPDKKGELFTDEIRLASLLKESMPEAVIFDLRMGTRPMKLMERVFFEKPSIIVITLLPGVGVTEEIYSDRELYWPVEISDIVESIQKVQKDREILRSCGIIGRSSALSRVADIIKKIAPSDISVMIMGPSGAGKEVIARAIHANSDRPDKPLIAVNVAAMAPGIIESELFGHERGSFTGASSRRIGAFEQASGGVLFLDEIGEIPVEIQAKLLRVLEQKVFTRVGGNQNIEADFRLLAATNRNLQDEIDAGRFREDLYFRINVVAIDIPPISERIADIAPLTYYFLDRRKKELKADNLSIEPGALRQFHRYNWPGNVRELKNVIDSFSVTSSTGRIRSADFEDYVRSKKPKSELLPVVTGRSPESAEHQIMLQAILSLTSEVSSLRHMIETEMERMSFADSDIAGTGGTRFDSVRMDDAERELILKALGETGGNRKKAASLLGIGERTLYRKLDKYGLK
ncbi:MAG: sigma-54 dependent transcriptional regulator [candidate division Zixibacteria bacterium]